MPIIEHDYTLPKEQIFFCCDKQGYGIRLNPKNVPEKQQMYNDYRFVVQVGFRSNYIVKLWLSNGSNRVLNPNTFRINKLYFITREPIDTISLEASK
jgi:hypothetical protein